MTQTKVEAERQRRICVSLWAYAYEVMNESLVSDHVFDAVCKEIDPSIETGHKVMDKFFKEVFGAHTGQWIHKHPELDKVKRMYEFHVIRDKTIGDLNKRLGL